MFLDSLFSFKHSSSPLLMKSPIIIFICFIVTDIISVTGAQDSPITCSTKDVACVIGDGNQLGNHGGISSIKECRQLCYDKEECQFITYYNSSSFPFNEVCELFKTCKETYPCSNCVSETRGCYETCSKEVVGSINDNLLDMVANVESEFMCKEQCGATQNCTFYTYFTEGDPNAKLCTLLSFLIAPFQPCETCVTGKGDCKDIQ